MACIRVYSAITRKQFLNIIRINYNKAKSLKLSPRSPIIFINGMAFIFNGENDSKEELDDCLKNIIWCSYRKDWYPPIENTQLTSDSGWGCMLRAGQMMFCEIIRRIVVPREEDSNEIYYKRIINAFNDNLKGEEAPFSIQNIVKLAEKEFGIQPGQWFRSTSIMMALDMLNKKYCPKSLIELEMITFVDSTIYINRLYDRVFDIKPRQPSEIKSSSKVHIEEHNGDLSEFIVPSYTIPDDYLPSPTTKSKEEMLEKLYSSDWSRPIVISIASRIGISSPNPIYAPFLTYLLTSRFNVGVLGGEGDRAYYIIGVNIKKEKFYYLDPHYIQDSSLDPVLNSYLQKPVNEYDFSDMNPCLQISFLVNNGEEMKELIEGLDREINRAGDEATFFSIIEHDRIDDSEYNIELGSDLDIIEF